MFDKIVLFVLIIGALLWGGVGLFGFDVVAWICGGQTAFISRILYSVIGLAGLWGISFFFKSHDITE